MIVKFYQIVLIFNLHCVNISKCMNINKLRYNLGIRDEKSTAMHIAVVLKNLDYKSNSLCSISEIYGVDKNLPEIQYVEYLEERVKTKNSENMQKILETIELMKKDIEENYDDFLRDMGEALDIDFQDNEQTYCYLHFIPMNEINFENGVIYLQCQKDIKEVIRNFQIMITKYYILKKFCELEPLNMNLEYEPNNKTCMFVELCIDAIVSNSNLKKYIPNPAYKYFYSLKLGNVNVLDSFRRLYPQISLDDFFGQVYMFVRDNYSKIQQFKSYLY